MAHLAWFAAISLLAFLVPFVFSSTLGLHHDLYYLIYFAVTLTVLIPYARRSGVPVRAYFTRRWKSSLLIGALATAFVVWSVLARIEPTPRPEGLYFGFEVAWRGIVYGVVDALLLSAFPGLVAWNVMGADLAGLGRRLGFSSLTLVLVLSITAAYHLGYEELRSREGIRGPELGNTVISLPVIVTANPAGSVLAHVSMHLAAVIHAYESGDRLPPRTLVGGRP
jgi:hypothetical protein